MSTIIELGKNTWRVGTVTRTGVLIDSENYYATFVEAARGARRAIYITGWEIDTETRLLRGTGRTGGAADQLLSFLNERCRESESLHVYILAWDYALPLALEREWLQKLVFALNGHPRIHFAYHGRHPIGASFHPKLVVIDDSLAFIGGIDLCQRRWDTSRHLKDDPNRRDNDGKPFEPMHDVQAYVEGAAAGALADWFRAEWSSVNGDAIRSNGDAGTRPAARFQGGIPIEASSVGISRTQGTGIFLPRKGAEEIRRLYIDAIRDAERVIYIETQYFTSRAVFLALRDRFGDERKGRLQVAVLLPSTKKIGERIFIEGRHSHYVAALQRRAREHGHRFGAYQVAPEGGTPQDAVHLHSKLLIVDDRFLSIGSANMANRSMGVDTELNLCWELAGATSGPHSIASLRAALLEEHTGRRQSPLGRAWEDESRLIDALDTAADSADCRLHAYHSNPKFPRLSNLAHRIVDPKEPLFKRRR